MGVGLNYCSQTGDRDPYYNLRSILKMAILSLIWIAALLGLW